jgi:hypothetical protein
VGLIALKDKCSQEKDEKRDRKDKKKGSGLQGKFLSDN